MTEGDIVKGLKARDESIFESFVRLHKERIVRICYGFMHDMDEANDLAQEVFIEVFRSIDRFKSKSSLSTWIYRIAINKSLNYLRDNKKRISLIKRLLTFTEKSEANLTTPIFFTNPLEEREREGQIKNAIHQSLSKLPKNQRTAFVLSKYEEMSNMDIAITMRLSVAAVESLLFRAKVFLKKDLDDFYKKIK